MAMRKINIWVEGFADQKFLADVLKVCFQLPLDENFEAKSENLELKIRKTSGVSSFISEKGWNGLKPFFETNSIENTKNLVVADSDDDYAIRKTEISNTLKTDSFDVENDLFLMPDNRRNGGLEHLLEMIIHPDHQAIFDCFENYVGCLEKSEKDYHTPLIKAKIFAFMEAILGSEGPIQEKNRDYTNENHWTLNGDIPPLKPLKDFLQMHLFPAENQ